MSDEALVLQVDATQPQNQAALANLALDPTKRATLRLAAARRLEEQAPGQAVPVARTLALSSSETADSLFLKKNSIALLARSSAPEASAALAAVKASSLDNAVLVARFTGKSGGN